MRTNFLCSNYEFLSSFGTWETLYFVQIFTQEFHRNICWQSWWRIMTNCTTGGAKLLDKLDKLYSYSHNLHIIQLAGIYAQLKKIQHLFWWSDLRIPNAMYKKKKKQVFAQIFQQLHSLHYYMNTCFLFVIIFWLS